MPIKKYGSPAKKRSKSISKNITFDFISNVFREYIDSKDGTLAIFEFRIKDDYMPLHQLQNDRIQVPLPKLFINTEDIIYGKTQFKNIVNADTINIHNLKADLKIAQEYFNSIYKESDYVIALARLATDYINDPYIINVKNSSLTTQEIHDLIYVHIYKEEKRTYDTEYSAASDYFNKYYNRSTFIKLADRYANYYKMRVIKRSKYLKNNFKYKLLFIELYKLVSEDEHKNRKLLKLKYGEKYNKFITDMWDNMDVEYEKAIKYFSDTYKFSDYINVYDYIEFLLDKFKNEKTLYDILNSDTLTDLTKKIFSIIYISILDKNPTTSNVNWWNTIKINNILKYPICIPFIDSRNTCEEKTLNYRYKLALQYFTDKFPVNVAHEINKLRQKYNKELNANDKDKYRQNLIKLMMLSKYDEIYSVNKPKIMNYFQTKYNSNYKEIINSIKLRYKIDFDKIKTELNILLLTQYIDETENRILNSKYNLASKYFLRKFRDTREMKYYIENKKTQLKSLIKNYTDKGYYEIDSFKFYNFNLDKAINDKIILYIIYLEDINANVVDKKPIIPPNVVVSNTFIDRLLTWLTEAETEEENRNKQRQKEIEKKLKIERDKQIRYDMIEDLYKNASDSFKQVYKTQDKVDKRIEYLEKSYEKSIKIIKKDGIDINTMLYTNFTDDEFNKIKIYYLYSREVEEHIIEKDYNTAMEYFIEEYGDNSDEKIDELYNKYRDLVNIDINYPDEIQEKYIIYRCYLYDMFAKDKSTLDDFIDGPLNYDPFI